MTDVDVKQVCKICYGSSSHKPNPTLTPESKAVFDGTGKKCTVCRQGWAPIRVAKDLGPAGGRWVRIRPRPKISANTEFQMCKNMQGLRGECPRSLDCSYAHNRIELALWNAERKLEPRPAPPITGPYQYQLCKNMQTLGSCTYGQRCTFAHSEEEYQEWLRSIHQTVPGQPVLQMPTIGGPAVPSAFVPVGSYRCDICSLTCTSRKQLDDHFAGIKHRERIFQMQGGPLPYGSDLPPGPPVSLNQNDLRTIRKRPLLSFQIMGFKMCMHIQANRRCIYGDFCTFAHSNEELQMWNRQLNTSAVAFPHLQSLPQNMMHFHPTPQPSVQVPSAMDHQKPDIFAASSGLDDFDEGQSQAEEARDFADDIRRQIADEFARKQEIGGFEKSHDHVCVEEVSGQELCLTWTQPDSLQWTFEVSTSAARILQSVVLFDTLATDFTILGAWLLGYGGHPQPLTATAALQGAGIQLRQRIAPPDRIHVKISLNPRSGVLGQLVIFDFGSFHLARGLSIHVLNETERKLVMNMGQPSRQRPTKPDLYWEQHYTPIAIPGHEQEEVFDKGLPEYPLPEQIEKLIDAGKYNNVENRVTETNYKRRLHNLLYLEEYQQRLDMSRYDLYDIEISPENTLHTGSMGVIYATEGFHYITVSVEEVLFEGGRSIRPGDSALLLPMNQQVMHECWVEKVGKDRVMLKITEKARQASASSRNRCSLRFVLSRTHMREMHYAVDQLDLASVFPAARVSGVHDTPPIPPSISKCLQELKTTKLNQSQQNAINSMLDPACQQIPSLVLGPFGCGKTRTLRECIMILSLLEGTTILICTHSNSAANIYIQELHREYSKRGHDSVSMIRIYYTGRRVDTIPSLIRQYCKMENGRLVLPSLSEVKQYRIVVVTLSTSRALSLMGVPKGHFSHIFIDEAAQALESETLIPLILANSSTKIVLAGDHMQMDPPCYSPIARKYGLHVSLLERLFDHEAYNSGVGQLCKTLLTENHRSHAHIMEIPSKLFYKNKLTCRAEFPRTGPHNIPPLKFIGVDGQEAQDEDSPSYYNNHEALKITEQVKLLVSGGLGQKEICVLSYYQKQVTRVRHLLRNEQLGQVDVFRVDDVQGKEYRALLLSTVRTCYSRDDGDLEEDAGFLTNPKLFNTAVTRAKEWLIVCGEPITLCTVGSNRLCWIELIKKCLHQLCSFEYSNASQFERFLETKLVTRKILEKMNAVFFQNIKKVQNPPVIPQAPKHPPPPPHSTSTEGTSTTVSTQHSFAQAQPHIKHQMLKSKVTELAHGNDGVTINKITDELMKLSLQEQVGLLARPEVLQHRVREVESVLRRPGPTAALLSATAVPNPVIGQGTPSYPVGTMGSHKYAPDLPPFLTSIIDGLTNYMKWCDMHLQNPLNNHHPGLKDNLTRQRANLGKQMELVNNQITMYRELLKIVRTAATAQNVNVENIAQNPLRGSVAHHVPPRPQVPSGPIHVSDPPQHFPGLPPPAIHHNYHHQQQQQQQVDHKTHVPPTTTVTVTPGINPRGSNFPQPSRVSFPTTSDSIHGITNLPASQHGHMTGHDSSQNRPSHFVSSSAFTYGMPKGAYFPNAQPDEPPLAQVLVQTNLTHSKSKGLSPLEAAINDASTRSSPLPFPQDTSDVYLSDDEFNS